jgi:phosphoglycolate phosphatase-like HAD superfamily hydrolase
MTKPQKNNQKTKHTNKRNNRNNRKLVKTRKHIPHKILPVTPSFEEKNLCCAIRFYDNFDEMIKQFQKAKKYVEAILVSNKPNKEIMHGNKNAGLYTQQFLKVYPDNKFAQYLFSINNKELGTNIGFSRDDAKDLAKWVLDPKIKTKIVIFDWDGTISAVEGVILPPTKDQTIEMFKKGITYKEIALYYAGTKERLEGFQNMFNFFHEKGVEVFILTNNPVAACNWRKLNDKGIGEFSRHNFYKVAKQFIPHIKLQNILCGYETDGFKPDSFNNNPRLRDVYARIQHWHFQNSASSSNSV